MYASLVEAWLASFPFCRPFLTPNLKRRVFLFSSFSNPIYFRKIGLPIVHGSRFSSVGLSVVVCIPTYNTYVHHFAKGFVDQAPQWKCIRAYITYLLLYYMLFGIFGVKVPERWRWSQI